MSRTSQEGKCFHVVSLPLAHQVVKPKVVPGFHTTLFHWKRIVDVRPTRFLLILCFPWCMAYSQTLAPARVSRHTAAPLFYGDVLDRWRTQPNARRLSALPTSIGGLHRKLEELLLNDNELSILPKELGGLTALKKLTTGCNPLLVPPTSTCSKGLQKVLEYLQGMEQGLITIESAVQVGSAAAIVHPDPARAIGDDDDPAAGDESMCSRCQALSSEMNELRDEIDGLQHQIGTMYNQKAVAEKDAMKAREQMLRKDKQLLATEAKLKQLQGDAKSKEAILHQRSTHHQQTGSQLQSELAELQAAVQLTAREKETLQAKLQECRAETSRMEQEVADVRREMQGLEVEHAALSQRESTARAAVETHRRESQSAQAAASSAKQQLKAAVEQNAVVQGELDGEVRQKLELRTASERMAEESRQREQALQDHVESLQHEILSLQAALKEQQGLTPQPIASAPSRPPSVALANPMREAGQMEGSQHTHHEGGRAELPSTPSRPSRARISSPAPWQLGSGPRPPR